MTIKSTAITSYANTGVATVEYVSPKGNGTLADIEVFGPSEFRVMTTDPSTGRYRHTTLTTRNGAYNRVRRHLHTIGYAPTGFEAWPQWQELTRSILDAEYITRTEARES